MQQRERERQRQTDRHTHTHACFTHAGDAGDCWRRPSLCIPEPVPRPARVPGHPRGRRHREVQGSLPAGAQQQPLSPPLSSSLLLSPPHSHFGHGVMRKDRLQWEEKTTDQTVNEGHNGVCLMKKTKKLPCRHELTALLTQCPT